MRLTESARYPLLSQSNPISILVLGCVSLFRSEHIPFIWQQCLRNNFQFFTLRFREVNIKYYKKMQKVSVFVLKYICHSVKTALL